MKDSDIRNTPSSTAKRPNQSGLSRVIAKVKCQLDETDTRKKEQESPADKAARVTAGATRAIAWLTGAVVLIAAIQLYEIIEGGKDTTAIADAAQKQVYAANRSADAAQKFADTTVLMNGNIDDAVGKLDAQARDIEASRKSSEAASTKALNTAIDNARTDQRAWLDLVISPPPYFQADKPFAATAELKNLGKTPAKNIQFGAIFEGIPMPANPITFDDSRVRFVNAGILPPQGSSALPVDITPGHPEELLGEGRFGASRDGSLAVFFWGVVNYDDTFGLHHWLKFAYIYNVPYRKFDLVSTHNNIDEDNR